MGYLFFGFSYISLKSTDDFLKEPKKEEEGKKGTIENKSSFSHFGTVTAHLISNTRSSAIKRGKEKTPESDAVHGEFFSMNYFSHAFLYFDNQFN